MRTHQTISAELTAAKLRADKRAIERLTRELEKLEARAGQDWQRLATLNHQDAVEHAREARARAIQLESQRATTESKLRWETPETDAHRTLSTELRSLTEQAKAAVAAAVRAEGVAEDAKAALSIRVVDSSIDPTTGVQFETLIAGFDSNGERAWRKAFQGRRGDGVRETLDWIHDQLDPGLGRLMIVDSHGWRYAVQPTDGRGAVIKFVASRADKQAVNGLLEIERVALKDDPIPAFAAPWTEALRDSNGRAETYYAPDALRVLPVSEAFTPERSNT